MKYIKINEFGKSYLEKMPQHRFSSSTVMIGLEILKVIKDVEIPVDCEFIKEEVAKNGEFEQEEFDAAVQKMEILNLIVVT